ncbi:hypothetical protein [Streptomyces sp. NPDC002785]|uniref:hypothetical protein n=1 Tax=Streptomyces sp. NPDC002785 TaxID=3154543 RepID=UPI00332B4E30
MPTRQAAPRTPFERVRGGHPGVPAELPRRVRYLDHPDVRFALRVLLPDVQIDTPPGSGAARAWLSDGRSSWATLDQGSAAVDVRRGGPRNLADEVAPGRNGSGAGDPACSTSGCTSPPTPSVFTGDDPHGPRWEPLVRADPASAVG